MKKVFISVLILIGNFSIVWADDLAQAATVPVVMKKSLTGVIKSISWADTSKGTKSEIIVKNTAGKTFNILITSTTTLWDVDAKAIMLDKIVAKKKVNVIYLTTTEGVNVGKSIKILK